MSSPPLQRSLTSTIAAELREAIVSGTYPAGAQLRQDALAQAFGVSRIPVREALFQLDAEGLVRITPQKGAVVAELSVREINDVFELRAILEPRLLRASLEAGDGATLDRAAEIHARFVAAGEAGDVREWGVLNAEFHAALSGAADLPRTATMAGGLLQVSDRYTRMQLDSREAVSRAVHEHEDLLRLSRAGRIDEACDALARHILHVGQDLLRVLNARRPPSVARAGARGDVGKGKSAARPLQWSAN